MNSGQLFQISAKGTRGGNVYEPNFLDWQAQTRGFAAMAETASGTQTVTGTVDPQQAMIQKVLLYGSPIMLAVLSAVWNVVPHTLFRPCSGRLPKNSMKPAIRSALVKKA